MHVNLEEEPRAENNFKLVCGTGNVISKEPLMDPFFNLKVRNTVRLRRTVEVYTRRPKRRKGDNIGCPCGAKPIKNIEITEANSRLTWVRVQNKDQFDLKSEVFFANETYLVD